MLAWVLFIRQMSYTVRLTRMSLLHFILKLRQLYHTLKVEYHGTILFTERHRISWEYFLSTQHYRMLWKRVLFSKTCIGGQGWESINNTCWGMCWWLVLQDWAYLHKPILSIQANKKMFNKIDTRMDAITLNCAWWLFSVWKIPMPPMSANCQLIAQGPML